MHGIAICDNVPQDLEALHQMTKTYLARRKLRLTVETYSGSAALLAAFAAVPERYSLLLLDLRLGEGSGVALARLLRERQVRARLVLISASPDFALEGYKLRADDYLVKPLSAEQFDQTLDRIFSSHTMVRLETASGTHMVQTADIRYVESAGHYVTVVTDTARLRTRHTLAALETQRGPDGLVRCHKGFLVNLPHVRELLDTELVLSSGARLPVGRQYHEQLQCQLVAYAARHHPSPL